MKHETNMLLDQRHIFNDGWVYDFKTVMTPVGVRTQFQSRRHSFTKDGEMPVTPIDYCFRPTADCVIEHNGDIYRFGSMGRSPVMSVVKNPQSWHFHERFFLTREDLILYLESQGFMEPHLIFSDTRLYPTWVGIPRLQDTTKACHRLSDMITRFASGNTTEKVGIVKDFYLEVKHLKEKGKIHRYAVIDLDFAFQRDDFLQDFYPAINSIFFDHGIVLLWKRSRDRGINQSPHGEADGPQYYDMKMLVDRRSVFDPAIKNGWNGWLAQQPQLSS